MAHTFGERLRGARVERAWTQEHLAAASGIGVRTVQRIENGKANPTAETLLALAGSLGVDVSELTTGLTREELATLKEDYFCPHCGARLSERTFVPHEYGDSELVSFECGFTRGCSRRRCPADPLFPRFEDYQLHFDEDRDGSWCCYAVGKTQEAREIELQMGRGRSRNDAAAWVIHSYIQARHGSDAANEYLKAAPTSAS